MVEISIEVVSCEILRAEEEESMLALSARSSNVARMIRMECLIYMSE